MTANDIFERVVALLGYSNSNGSQQGLEVIKSRTVNCVNQILSDLALDIAISDLNDDIMLNKVGLDALVYGVAMLLSLGMGDGEKNVLFAGLYNIKRSAYMSVITERSDVLPSDDGGV